MREDLVLTRLYHALPNGVREMAKRGISQFNPLVALKFYYGSDCVLRTKGWVQSEIEGYPVNESGEPVPWYTLPLVDLLEERDISNCRAFEYGSGFSTVWYADRVANIVAVEHDPEWATRVRERTPESTTVVERSVDDGYTNEILNHGEFDIIVIDGKDRRGCVRPALDAVSEDGIIIWDDFQWLEREDYQPLLDSGYRVLPFRGIKALKSDYTCTAVFYQDENCIGI